MHALAKPQDRAEVVRTVADVDDAVEVGLVPLQECLKLVACRRSWCRLLIFLRVSSGEESVPLHMLGLQPTLHSCWGPDGSIRLRSLSRPEGSHSAGLVTISSNRFSRPLDCECD